MDAEWPEVLARVLGEPQPNEAENGGKQYRKGHKPPALSSHHLRLLALGGRSAWTVAVHWGLLGPIPPVVRKHDRQD